MKTPSYVLGLLLSITFVACSNEDDPSPLYGAPTPIANGQAAIDVVCAIQTEFTQLPKPLMVRQSYQSEWTSRPIGAANVKHQGFIRIHLSDEALAFLQQHSRLELVASLAPLLYNSEVSGEVAVLFAGIPAGDKAEQGLLTRNLAAVIDQRAYSSPRQPGQWHQVDQFKYHYLNRFYGLLNTTSRIHKKEISGYKGSLEEIVVSILEDYSRVTPLPLEGDRLFGPRTHDDNTVTRWIKEYPVPSLKPKPQAFIDKYTADKHTKELALVTLLPLMPQPSAFMESTEYYMIWLLGLEQEYWPAAIAIPHGEAIPAKLRNQLRQKIAETTKKICS